MRNRSLLYPVILLLLFNYSNRCFSQRIYTSSSVLASGNWFRIGVTAPGIYRIDLPFLQKLGVNTSNIPSSALRLYGNGGGMLPEGNSMSTPDDLLENRVKVVDGGDGIFDVNDYLLFYSAGPDQWLPDLQNQTFHHRHNLYSDTAFYYLTIAGAGQRIQLASLQLQPSITINQFTDRYVHELDTFNFLSSGKQWFGEEFAQGPGKVLARQFPIPQAPELTGPAVVRFKAVARSFGGPSVFNLSNGNGVISQLSIAPVATGPYDQFARTDSTFIGTELPAGFTALSVEFVPAGSNTQGWLDWIELFPERNLNMAGLPILSFRTYGSVAPGAVAQFNIQNTSSEVWDVTDPLQPIEMQTQVNQGSTSFINRHDSLREYIAFDAALMPKPLPAGRIANQDLHAPKLADMLIVSYPAFRQEALRLANYHLGHDSLRVVVVTTDELFNEFSSGSPDPSAIRNYVKMFYDRAAGDSSKMPKYLLLFGDASFDYKNRIVGNTSFVPCYETTQSLDPLSTYTSDDYFGFLDDAEDINGNQQNLLDIGIGRIPAGTLAEAKAIVDKIIQYHSPASLGPWRNELSFIADDEDANLHLSDAEAVTNVVSSRAPQFNPEKIYLDAYRQQAGAGGATYPEVNSLMESRMNNGNLIWNYNGHGGYRRLAEEVVLDQAIIDRLTNVNRLPLFITATCDVAPFDNPLVRSIGENLLLRPKTGGIALMATTRLVFAFSNRVMNSNYLDIALRRRADSAYLSLGDACRLTKNYTYQFSGDIINNRKFTLLGDPALTIAYPVLQVVTTAVNGRSPDRDTLKAMSRYTIEGEVRNASGQVIQDFNGTVYPEIYDKSARRQTLGNDPGSIPVDFEVHENRIYKGKATVRNGKFSYSFIVPRDINYALGNSRVTHYADNGTIDGNGVNERLLIGGTGDSSADKEAPAIKLYLNDERFIPGSITNEQPVLLAKFTDSSGINISGSSVGHDLLVMIDNDPKQQFVLNQYYQADLDTYQKGSLKFQLPRLSPGLHTLSLKAWDVMNNSGSASIDFQVRSDEGLVLDHVINYPNPFTTHTNFWFDHNRPGEELRVQVQIFTVTGKLVKTLRNTIITTGNRSNEVQWDGRDEYGNKIGRGVYIYNLRVEAPDGKSARKIQKLYLL